MTDGARRMADGGGRRKTALELSATNLDLEGTNGIEVERMKGKKHKTNHDQRQVQPKERKYHS
jgi:hypothetical protein